MTMTTCKACAWPATMPRAKPSLNAGADAGRGRGGKSPQPFNWKPTVAHNFCARGFWKFFYWRCYGTARAKTDA